MLRSRREPMGQFCRRQLLQGKVIFIFNFTNYVLIIEPTTLVGRYIILRPPSIEDINGLSIAARDGEIWNNRFSQFPNLNEIEKYIQEM